MVSEELKKMFEGRIAMQDMHYVGKACYGRLSWGKASWTVDIPVLPFQC